MGGDEWGQGHHGQSQPLLPGHVPPPQQPPQQRHCEAAAGAAAGGSPGCSLLPDKSLKGKEPVVYPWMKKIHVSTGELTFSKGEPRYRGCVRAGVCRAQLVEEAGLIGNPKCVCESEGVRWPAS